MRVSIKPQDMTERDWFDRTTQLFADVFPPMKLLVDGDWQTWASAARRVVPELPDPYTFNAWQLWAERFNLIMGAA